VTTTLSPEEVRPIALVGANLFRSGPENVVRQLDSFDRIDDVFSKAFADTIVLAHSGASGPDTDAATSLNHSGLSSTVMHSTLSSSATSLPPGPYFLCGSNIHQAWRLYPDDLDAFVFGVVPQNVLDPQTLVDHM
jgi:hypothetical protein